MATKESQIEYKAISYVFIVGVPLPVKFESGWFYTEAQAREELDRVLEQNLKPGLYDMSINIKERQAL